MQVLTSHKDLEMWGDGAQTRSFTYIDDCVEGILRITKSDYKEPLNLGSSEMVGHLLAGASMGASDFCIVANYMGKFVDEHVDAFKR